LGKNGNSIALFPGSPFFIIILISICMKRSILLYAVIFTSNIVLAQNDANSNSILEIERPKTIQAGKPEEAGMSSERLVRLDNYLQKIVDEQKMNGVVAMVIRDGKVVYEKAFGYDNIEKKTPMKKDAIFRIASQTKAITSVAILTLYEEGKFLLDDPISKFIPEFSKPKVIEKFKLDDTTYTTVPAKREITIRDLLTHSSGIAYAQIGSPEANALYGKAGVFGGIGVGNITLAEQMKKLAVLPLFHQPGEKFTYGLNTDVLGYLVEVVSGMSLDKYLQQRIFQPLGMKDTYFYIPKDKHERLVSLYSEGDSHKLEIMKPTLEIDKKQFNRDFPNTAGSHFSGGGGLSSTIHDYAIFLQMLLNGGEYNGARILSPSTIRMMTSNQIGDKEIGDHAKFGLGVGIATEKTAALFPPAEGSYNWGGMFATSYWVDPKQKLVGLVYRNIWPTSYWELDQKFKALVYQAIVDSTN
jgi:CubicO group peptidase (beta-lactamase class C family)